jgi:hypothetical protein
VSAVSGIGTVGGSTNSQTTTDYYYMPASSYSPVSATGTSTSASACSITGWTKLTSGTAADIPSSTANTAYVLRLFETDALGNARCTDLSATANDINSNAVAFAAGKLGVDKVPPTAAYLEPATNPAAAANNAVWNEASVGTVPNNFQVDIAMGDDASGTGPTPVTTMVTRLFVDPATGAQSTVNSTNGCPSGLSGGACSSTAAAATLPGWFNATAGSLADASGCVGCGYYVFSQTPLDLARNAATSVTGSSPTVVTGNCAAVGCREVLIDTMRPTMGGIQVPATITGGTTVAFGTSATDNLDLASYDYSLLYPTAAVGTLPANIAFRSPNTVASQQIGTAFDNVLTTQASFSLNVSNFIRDLETTSAANQPQNVEVQPSQITGRVYDAAGNGGVGSASVAQSISAVNVPIANRVDFAAAEPNTATLQTFMVANAATNISNGPASVSAVNPTTVTLSATATGPESNTFQYINPFTVIQFYYLDPASGEFILIGSASAANVTDNGGVTLRTFTWTISWDPPASLPAGPVSVIAVGVNSAGDALVSQANQNITLTNP